jgi:CO/xanthine dehydrogenase Mo-binding subunit
MTATHSSDRLYNRKSFLAATGALVVAIGAPRLSNPKAAYAVLADDFPIGPPQIDPKQIDSWVAIRGDGKVTIFTGKEEQGTGVATAQVQVAADELDVALDSITLISCDTNRTPDQGFSSASQTLSTEFGPNGLRQACAEARAALLSMAAAHLNAPIGDLSVANGVVSVAGNPDRSISYARLVGGRKFNLEQTGKAAPKPFSAYKIVGKSVPRLEIPDIVFGSNTYVPDVHVPGMLYARVVRPPTLDSTLERIGGFRGGRPSDLVRVVQKHNFVAVVSRSEWGAVRAARDLDVTWQTAPLPSFERFYDDLIALSPASVQVVVDTRDVDEQLARAERKLNATYRYPLQMHGPLGASASTAWVKDHTATIWTSSQGVYPLRALLATALNLPAQSIRVIFVEGSGHYGMCAADNASLDAAVISQAVHAPVRVQYSRSDEHRWENYGAPYVWTLNGAVDISGPAPKIAAWDRAAWTATRGGRPGPPANLPSGILLGFPELPPPSSSSSSLTPSQLPNVPDNPNSVPAYAIPSQRIVTHTGQHTFMNAPLRSPNRIQNTFANETFIDELAHLAAADPLEFRLAHITDPRLLAVTQAAARMARWERRPAASKVGTGRFRTGRGISTVIYEGNNGYSALVASVTVDTKTGKVTADHAWSAQDSGPAVNPDGMKAQAEGGLMQGISRALIEELRWGPDGIVSSDWVTYPVVRFDAMPTFAFQIVNRPDRPVMGAGEVLITNVPAAIGNAIFDATGKRLRQVPFTPARVRAALAE